MSFQEKKKQNLVGSDHRQKGKKEGESICWFEISVGLQQVQLLRVGGERRVRVRAVVVEKGRKGKGKKHRNTRKSKNLFAQKAGTPRDKYK